MEKEISSGAMLGIVLIALAAVIGLGFGVFSIAKGISNTGVNKVQDRLNTVSQSDFDDFNDTIISGTQVLAAIQTFNGKAVALLVNTKTMNSGVPTYKEHAVHAIKIGSDVFVNYNAIISVDTNGEALDTISAGKEIDTVAEKRTAIEVDKTRPNVVLLHTGFAINPTDGTVMYDTQIGGMSRSGNCEYIATTAKFQANLIVDATDTPVGITFKQLAQ